MGRCASISAPLIGLKFAGSGQTVAPLPRVPSADRKRAGPLSPRRRHLFAGAIIKVRSGPGKLRARPLIKLIVVSAIASAKGPWERP